MTFSDQAMWAQQMECLQEVIPVAVMYCQPVFDDRSVADFRCIWGNRKAYELAALSRAEFERMTLLGLFPHLADSDTLHRYVQVWESGDARRFEQTHGSGSTLHWMEVSVDRKFEGLVITLIDITDAKEARQALERQTHLLQNIVENLPAGLALFNPLQDEAGELVDFRYGLTNPANAQFLGTSVESLSGNTLLNAYPSAGEKGVLDHLKEVMETGVSRHFHTYYCADGLNIWLEGHFTRVEDGVLLMYQDNTALKQQQLVLLQQADRLGEQNAQLNQANAALTRANQRLQGQQAIERALLNRSSTEEGPEVTALRHTQELVPCEQLVVFQFDPKTDQARSRSWLFGKRMASQVDFDLPVHWFNVKSLLSGQPLVINQLAENSTCFPPELTLYNWGYRSLMIVPLFSQQEYIGAFILLSHTPHFFTEEHLQIAQEVGSQLAVVLDQQRLDEQVRNYTQLLEQRVAQRTGQIRQLSALQNAILKHAGQAIVSTDIDGVIQTANPASEKLLGYGINELLGRPVRMIHGTANQPTPLISFQREQLSPISPGIKTTLAAQSYFYSECLMETKAGERLPVLLAASTLQDEDGTIIGYMGIATDISDLKAAEQNLQQKNQELNTFFEGALDMHCISNSQGNIAKANEAFQTVLGYSETELMAMPFLQLIHPDEQKEVFHHLLVPILRQPVRNQVNRFRKKDGSYRTIEWNAVAIDQVVYGSARDITERQEAENQLLNLHQRLQLATQAAQQGTWEYDFKQDRLYWDQRMFEIHGMPPVKTAISFKDFIARIHPEDLATFLSNREKASETKTITGVARIIRPDGAIRYTETHGILITDEAGVPVRTGGVVWDVTQRVEAERALRESEQRFRQIAENVDEVFWIHSSNPFQLLYVNPAYERLWDRSCQSLYDDPSSFIEGVVDEDKPAVQAFSHDYITGKEGQLFYRLKAADGSLRWVSARTFIVRDAAGQISRHIGVVSDVTSQKETELILQQSLAREQELNSLKSHFVATASHEFRTPLTTIQSSTELIGLYLKKSGAGTNPVLEKHLKLIQQQIHNLTSLLADLLTMGRIEAGKVAFDPQLVDVLLLCQQVIASHFGHQPDGREVRISLIGEPYLAFLDEKLMKHVLANLLSNAFKFSREDPRLVIRFEPGQLVLDVVDEGIGIPSQDLPSLFQTFFRARNTSAIQGTGLGLVIARQYVEMHGGTLTVQSQENVGTTFTLILPGQPTE